ncbi:hypothetical protein ACQJBY_008655 [Aegilops geniculata]
MPHHGALPDEEAPSPRPSAAGCYTFLRSAASRRGHGHGYRRLESASVGLDVVRVEVGTTAKARSVFHVDPAVLEAEPVRRLVAAAGRRTAGGAVAVAVDALLFEHLLWLAATDGAAADDLSEIVEFYSEEEGDKEQHHGGHGFKLKR